jgi:hypothetical protein
MLKVAVLIILLPSLTAQAASSKRQTLAGFHGVLLDVNDARIAHATVAIESRTGKLTFQSDEEGLFDVKIPLGSYQLVVEARGFERFRIKRLEVKKNGIRGMTIHLNVDRNNKIRFEGIEPEEPPIEPQKAPLSEKIRPRRIH